MYFLVRFVVSELFKEWCTVSALSGFGRDWFLLVSTPPYDTEVAIFVKSVPTIQQYLSPLLGVMLLSQSCQ